MYAVHDVHINTRAKKFLINNHSARNVSLSMTCKQKKKK